MIAQLNMATLRDLREKAGLRPEEAAYKLGVALSTLRNWEVGRSRPTMNPDQFIKTLEIYDCSLEEFAEATRESYQQDTTK